ncbi:hypothetical protein BDL97_13G010900 [Sphagnum fallax]|nr:hypothetical protein BDL97_13G010900 [Sphagnum fallax]
MFVKRYGGRGEACTRGRLRIEHVPQWLRRRNGENGLTTAGSAFSAAKVCVSSRSLIRPYHSSALLALSSRGGGPAPAAAPDLSAGHGPPPATRSGRPGAGATLGLSTEHGPRRGTRDGGPGAGAAPGLLAWHGPRRGARGCSLAVVAGPGLSARHELRRVAHGRGRGPVAVAGPGLSAGQIDAS